MKYFLHKLSHKLKWYKGIVVSKTVKDHVWVGFKCSTCGKVEDWHDAECEIFGKYKKEEK
jgi:predicted RNA-binding Zn-ribbon protein involved in translation (DUF1610 family)